MRIFISILAFLMGLFLATLPVVAQHQHGGSSSPAPGGEKKMEPS
ncbi:MAG: hypothetical protein H6Q44_2253, partial [Deltaproteobacteria bacterium]|nr:hypothetical protein [Deltaproteobacteria bacterium]